MTTSYQMGQPVQSFQKPVSYFLQTKKDDLWEIDGEDEELKKKWRRPDFRIGRSVPSELVVS